MIYGFGCQSGGQVRIYSKVGQGTTICIYLPRHADDALPNEEEGTIATNLAASGQTILMVDDEATIRHLIDEVLDEERYTVIGAADGAAGLKVLQSSAKIELFSQGFRRLIDGFAAMGEPDCGWNCKLSCTDRIRIIEHFCRRYRRNLIVPNPFGCILRQKGRP